MLASSKGGGLPTPFGPLTLFVCCSLFILAGVFHLYCLHVVLMFIVGGMPPKDLQRSSLLSRPCPFGPLTSSPWTRGRPASSAAAWCASEPGFGRKFCGSFAEVLLGLSFFPVKWPTSIAKICRDFANTGIRNLTSQDFEHFSAHFLV